MLDMTDVGPATNLLMFDSSQRRDRRALVRDDHVHVVAAQVSLDLDLERDARLVSNLL